MVILLYDIKKSEVMGKFFGYNEGIITVFKAKKMTHGMPGTGAISPLMKGVCWWKAVLSHLGKHCTCELPLCRIIKNET